MNSRARSVATFAIFVALFPALAAPSCDTPEPVKKWENEPLPIAFGGPTYGPIAVGASVSIDSKASPEIVNGDAFTIEAGGLLHATKPGTSTVRFQTFDGVKDFEYRALVADAVDVTCPGGGSPCLITASWDVTFPFALFAGGKGGTHLVSGDLCPFAAPPSIPFRCEQDLVHITVAGGASGTLSTTVDAAARIDIEGVAREAVDALGISFTPLPGGASADVLIVATKGGKAIDVDRFERHVTVETPLVCGIDGGMTDGIASGTVLGSGAALSGSSADLWVYKKATGTCTVSAQLTGTTTAAKAQFTF